MRRFFYIKGERRMSDLEQMARLEERLRQVAEEHPICRQQLQDVTQEIKEIRERLACVEQSHGALERAVFDMKKDLKEQISDFKKFVFWAIGLGISISGIVASILPYLMGR